MPQYFEYTHLESHIHYFKWLSRSEDAAIEYFDFITQLYDDLPKDTQVIRILHDYQHLTFIPLANVFPKIKTLQSMYPNLNRRIAYLSDDKMTETLLDSITIVAKRTGNRKFFKLNEKQLAIKWLLEDV